jgi:hypothetical protein
MNILCACGCNRLTGDEPICDSGGAWWRASCAVRTLKGVRCLQNLPPDALGALVGILRVHGFGLADTVVGALPFDTEPIDYGRMLQ